MTHPNQAGALTGKPVAGPVEGNSGGVPGPVAAAVQKLRQLDRERRRDQPGRIGLPVGLDRGDPTATAAGGGKAGLVGVGSDFHVAEVGHRDRAAIIDEVELQVRDPGGEAEVVHCHFDLRPGQDQLGLEVAPEPAHHLVDSGLAEVRGPVSDPAKARGVEGDQGPTELARLHDGHRVSATGVGFVHCRHQGQ